MFVDYTMYIDLAMFTVVDYTDDRILNGYISIASTMTTNDNIFITTVSIMFMILVISNF